jgi:nicotinamidase-related amidase
MSVILALEPLAGEKVFQKHFPNSFRETPLQETARKQDVDRLVIAGAMTQMCVDATVFCLRRWEVRNSEPLK